MQRSNSVSITNSSSFSHAPFANAGRSKNKLPGLHLYYTPLTKQAIRNEGSTRTNCPDYSNFTTVRRLYI